MGPDAGDFSFEQTDARVEFVQRIAIQAFAGEEAGGPGVTPGRPQPRSVVVFHCSAASNRKSHVSIP